MNKLSSRVVAAVGLVAVGAGLIIWLGRDTATVVKPAQAVAPRCGDDVVNQRSEECDGKALPPTAPPGARCSPNCRLMTTDDQVQALIDEEQRLPRCGDGVINQKLEECDGTTLPENAPAGAHCSRFCALILPEQDECQECLKRSCAEPRAAVDKSSGSVGPLLSCVLGKDWARGGHAPKDSCARQDLLTCYCGKTKDIDCASAPPSSLNGQCTAEILAATDCTTSQCVATQYMRPSNANGLALSYAQCEQDNCYEDCFK